MLRSGGSPSYRMFAIGIGISLLMHLFWISAIDIVSATAPEHPLKFSTVTFLGPILSGVGMQVHASPADRSLLEKRYVDYLRSFAIIVASAGSPLKDNAVRPKSDPGRGRPVLDHLVGSGDVIAADKIEPECKAE